MACIACLCTLSGFGTFAGREIPTFVCSPGVFVDLNQLCDGVNDCGNGDDETSSLCESKLITSSL